MPTLNEAREAIYQRWADNSPLPSAQYVFEANAFSPPTLNPWARVSVLHVESEQETLGPSGSRRFLRPGSAIVKLYGRKDRGRRELDLLAQSSRAVFEGTSFSGLNFMGATAREGQDEGEWLVAVIEAPFFYEETK